MFAGVRDDGIKNTSVTSKCYECSLSWVVYQINGPHISMSECRSITQVTLHFNDKNLNEYSSCLFNSGGENNYSIIAWASLQCIGTYVW